MPGTSTARGRGLDRSTLTLEQRCQRIKTNGEQCRNPKIEGLSLCIAHGGRAPAAKEIAARTRVVEQMRKLRIPPADEHDPEVSDPAATLAAEVRRTLGWIRFCEDRITALSSDDELIYGQTGEVVEEGYRDDAGVSVTTTTFAAGAHEWINRLEWNRRHLAVLTKLWIDAGFEAARLALEERLVDRLEAGIDAIVSDLGLNPRDAAVRAVVRRRLSELS